MYTLIGRWCLTTGGAKVAVYTVVNLQLYSYSYKEKVCSAAQQGFLQSRTNLTPARFNVKQMYMMQR